MLAWLYSTRAFAALGARNFRIFIFGQVVSLVGTWMQRLAMSWLVLRLTGSAAGLGLIELSNQAPILVTGFLAGTILDRYDMKKILIVTQSLCMVQAFALAMLDFSGAIRYSQVLLLSIMLGVIASVDMPARQSCVPRMLDDKSQLNSALTINSAVFNLARLIGPALGGFALQAIGEAACFLLNGVSFMTVIYSLTKLKIRHVQSASRQNGWKSFKEGLLYAKDFEVLRKMLTLSALFFFISNPFATLLPFFAKNIFDSSASALGFFMGSVGLGAVIGVIYQASFVAVERLHRRVVLSVAVYGIGIISFACSRSVMFSCFSLTLLGFGLSTGAVCFNTVIQSVIDENKRGRVMSLYAICNIGIGPLGSLAAGVLADIAGGTFAGVFFGLCAVILSFFMNKNMHRIEKQILRILKEKGLVGIR